MAAVAGRQHRSAVEIFDDLKLSRNWSADAKELVALRRSGIEVPPGSRSPTQKTDPLDFTGKRPGSPKKSSAMSILRVPSLEESLNGVHMLSEDVPPSAKPAAIEALMNMSTSFQAATSATPGSPQHHVPRQLPSAIFTRVVVRDPLPGGKLGLTVKALQVVSINDPRAQNFGFLIGDHITSVNDVAVSTSQDFYREMASASSLYQASGRPMALEVWRTPSAAPPGPFDGSPASHPSSPHRSGYPQPAPGPQPAQPAPGPQPLGGSPQQGGPAAASGSGANTPGGQPARSTAAPAKKPAQQRRRGFCDRCDDEESTAPQQRGAPPPGGAGSAAPSECGASPGGGAPQGGPQGSPEGGQGARTPAAPAAKPQSNSRRRDAC